MAIGHLCVELFAGEDEATADREVLFVFSKDVAISIPGLEDHAVGVLGQWLVIKGDFVVDGARRARDGAFAGDCAAGLRLGIDGNGQRLPAGES